MEIKVLGICGSPVKGGNTEVFLIEALKAAQEQGEVSTELIALAGKDIRGCLHCNFCVRKQEEGKFCNQKDDLFPLYPKIIEADALLVATPVYFARLSGRLGDFLDRLRCLNEGKFYKRRMENKVGGALSVAWYRNTGLETALLSIIYCFFALKMIPVGPGKDGCQWGATGISSYDGTGRFDPEDRLEVLKDQYGLRSARNLGKRVVDITRVLKSGQEALKVKQLAAI